MHLPKRGPILRGLWLRLAARLTSIPALRRLALAKLLRDLRVADIELPK
jgi:hypothetical protein